MRLRDFIDPGGRQLSRRLDQLKDTLDHLGDRLRGTIADAIGQTLSGIVRDTAVRVLDHLAEYFPGTGDSQPIARHEPWNDRDIWLDEEAEREPEPQQTAGSSDRMATAVSAGMYVASLWLRRWTGKSRSLTTAAVGLVAGGVAYVGGPVAAVVLSLAGIASEFTSLTDVIGNGCSVSFFDPV